MKTKYISRLLMVMFCFMVALSSCAQHVKQSPPLSSFYNHLDKQMHSEHFSPLAVSHTVQNTEHEFLYEKDSEQITIESGDNKIHISLTPFQVSYETENRHHTTAYTIHLFLSNSEVCEITELKSPTKKLNRIVFNTNIKGSTLTLTPHNGNLKWEINVTSAIEVDSISLTTQCQGPFFGGGERFMSTCLNGRSISNQPNDHFFIANKISNGTAELKNYEPSYLQIPFVLNPHGQGWYFDSSESIFLSFSKGKLRTSIADRKMFFYTFQENSPKEVLEEYTALLGRQPELPDWAHGVWLNLLEGQDSVLAKASRLKKQKMPLSAVWLFDMDDPNTSTGWPYWSRGLYPNYRTLTDSIHKLGYKVLTYLRPFGYKNLLYYKFENPFYNKYDSLGLILKTRNDLDNSRYKTFNPNSNYDFYNKRMGREWQQVISELLIDDNFDGWMEDFGDNLYALDVSANTWQALDFKTDYPLSANEYANTYPLVYHKLSYELSAAIKPDIATFCRSGSAGSAPFTRIVWGGDQIGNWDKTIGFPSAITAGISCGLSGYSNWAPDVLCDSPSEELWKRWVQFSAFTPLMRDHLWANKESSIDIWTNKESFNYFKRYAHIHMNMLPYIIETAKTYRSNGTPIIRHMMLEFPTEKETYFCEFQYMFGAKYLVAPVVEENARTKNVYFPKGNWKDFWDDTVIKSTGEWIEVNAPVDYIPVYERL